MGRKYPSVYPKKCPKNKGPLKEVPTGERPWFCANFKGYPLAPQEEILPLIFTPLHPPIYQKKPG